MDWNRVCPSCMRELPQAVAGKTFCPHCGFAKAQENRENALPVNTILNGKYIVGKILARTEEEITYLAYDLNLEMKIQIAEYFPVTLAERAEDGRKAQPKSGQETAFSEGLVGYREKSKALVKAGTVTGDESSIREVFKENRTAYRVLFALPEETDATTMPGSLAEEDAGVTTMPGSLAEEAGATTMPGSLAEEEKGAQSVAKKKKKWVLFAALAAAVLLVGVITVVSLLGGGSRQSAFGNGDSTRVNGNGAGQAEESTEHRSSYLGAYYEEENVVLLMSESAIYFGHPNEEGEIPDMVWLTDLRIIDSMLSIAVEDGCIYLAGEGGIYRAPIQASEVNFTQIVQRDVWSDVVFYDKYLFYAANNVLYRAEKDGSNEIVLNSNASSQFTVYGDKVLFYSEDDGYIHKMNLDGSEDQKWMDGDTIFCMVSSGGYLFVNSNGRIYQINIESGLMMNTNGIKDTMEYTEILVEDGKIYFASADGTQIYGYEPNMGETATAYIGESYGMAAFLHGRLYVAEDNGDYFSVSLAGGPQNKLGLNFNYFTAAEQYGK